MKYSGSLRWILPVLIIFWFINVSAAFELGKLQWDDNGVSQILKRNEVISLSGYSVKVVGFSAPVESEKYKQRPIDPVEPFVKLNISNNGSFINSIGLKQGESYILPDGELKVTALGLPPGSSTEWLYESYAPWAKVELSLRGKPEPEIIIESDDEYVSAPNTEINVEVVLKNTGTADLTNVDVNINSEIPVLRNDLKKNYEFLKKGEEVSQTITFSTPVIMELKEYNILVNISGKDIKDTTYEANQLKTIVVAPQPQQVPSFKKSTTEKIYLKDQIMVSLSFKNNANYELKNVSIVDSIPKGFKQLNNNSLKWVVNISPNGEWYFRYLLKPTEANGQGVLFPSATAQFKIKGEYFMIQSNMPETVVYGPKIELSKQSDVSEINPGDTVTITVVAVNSESTPTMVTINDNLPSDVTLISGSTNIEEYLEANQETSFSYTIRSNSDGPISLPPATAEYFELGSKGTKISTMSQGLLINIKPPPTPEPTPEPTVDAEIPVYPTGEENIQEDVGYVVDITQPDEQQPFLPEPGPESLYVDSNAVLNLLVGCDKIGDIASWINTTSEVCSFIANNQ